MQLEQFNEIVDSLIAEARATTNMKRKSYAGHDADKVDVLANFKRNAERLGLTPFQVWAVYWGKHVDSVLSAIKANPSAPVDEAEGLRGRIIDLQVYGWILEALLEETTDSEITSVYEVPDGWGEVQETALT